MASATEVCVNKLYKVYRGNGERCLQVVGRTRTSHVIDNPDASSLSPTTSAPTGAMVVQKVPETVPTNTEKNINTPKLLAKIYQASVKAHSQRGGNRATYPHHKAKKATEEG